jgi:hypothetical protein
MGKLNQIKSKLDKLYQNKSKIFEGLKNSLFKNDFVEKVALARFEICKTCPHIDLKGDKCMVSGTQPCCGKCGCSLGMKTRSLSSDCGDEELPRWFAVLDQEQEDEIYGE